MDNAVAFTGGRFQLSSVRNPYRPTSKFYAFSLLENGRRIANGRSVRTKYRREGIVSHGYQGRTNPVVCHQQPPGETLLNAVEAIACNRLRDLQPLDDRVATQPQLELRSRF